MYTLESVSSVANFITAYEVSIKSRLPFSICNVYFFLTFIVSDTDAELHNIENLHHIKKI